MMSENSPPSTSPQQELFPTSSAEVSPARTSAQQARARVLKASAAAYGRTTPVLLARYDRASLSWRTSQHSLLGGLSEFSETWPRSGTMRNGTAYLLPPLVPLTAETESGLWPTPDTHVGGRTTHHVDEIRGNSLYAKGSKVQFTLETAAKLWPTPTARDTKGKDAGNRQGGVSLPTAIFRDLGSSKLNPNWVEWLMGYPIGHTELKPSATRSSRKSPS